MKQESPDIFFTVRIPRNLDAELKAIAEQEDFTRRLSRKQ